MKKLLLAVMVIVILFASVPGKAAAKGDLSCPPRWGTFNETTLDLTILSVLDTTVSGYVTDYKNTVTFGPVHLGKARVKRLFLSYSLHNTTGLQAKFFFTQITPMGRTAVTECTTTRGAGFFSIRGG